MTKNAENEWVERAKQGEAEAIAELYGHYWRAARATAYGVTADFALAEDAASEAFFAALESLQDLRDSSRFGPWLHTIVIRVARRLRGSETRKNAVNFQPLTDTQTEIPSSNLEQRELAALIHEAVGNLPEMLREAISIFYFEGYNIEQAALFLDIPSGTLKRRLHDGRRRLREAAEKILKGKKPMDQQRERILQQLGNLIDQGGDSEALHKVMRQALRLRPVPYELLSKLMQRHSKVAKKLATPGGREEMERRARAIMEDIGKPSQRILDPDHVIGKVALEIRAALPEFKEWKIDKSQAAQSIIQRLSGDFTHPNLPPGFAEGTPGSYICASRGSLFQKQDGSICTMYELMQKGDNEQAGDAEFMQCGRLSDILVLMWMRLDNIEMRSVEELLRRLSREIVPEVEPCFLTYDEPGYRSALQMQFGDILIPAAIGGVCSALPWMPDGVSLASVRIFLEAWATAQSGRIVELVDMAPLFKQALEKTPPFHSQDDKK